MVPNLQDSLVDVHVHGGTKRKVKLPIRVGKGKDVKKVRAAVMRAVSASGVKGSEAGLIELPETTGRKDIEINVPESLINSIDNMEPRALVKTIVEFSSKTLLLSRRVGGVERRKLISMMKKRKLGKRIRRSGNWKGKGLLCGGYDALILKKKHDRLEGELEDLKSCIIQEHINGFQKGVRQASFFYENVDANDVRFDVNKDVVDGVLIDEEESSPEGNGENEAVDADVGGNEVVAEDIE